MPIEKKIICPLMKSQCIEDGHQVGDEIHACRFWITVHGKHPQSGEVVHTSDCSIAWVPMLLIENTKEQRGTGAAVESFRNEMVDANRVMAALTLGTEGQLELGFKKPPG